MNAYKTIQNIYTYKIQEEWAGGRQRMTRGDRRVCRCLEIVWGKGEQAYGGIHVRSRMLKTILNGEASTWSSWDVTMAPSSSSTSTRLCQQSTGLMKAMILLHQQHTSSTLGMKQIKRVFMGFLYLHTAKLSMFRNSKDLRNGNFISVYKVEFLNSGGDSLTPGQIRSHGADEERKKLKWPMGKINHSIN